MNVWKWGYSALDEHQHSFTHTYKWVFLSSYHHCMWCKFYTFFLRWVQIEPTQILAVAGYKAKGRIQIAANLLAVNSSEKVWNYENMEKKTHSRTTNYLSVKGRGGDIKWTRTYTHTHTNTVVLPSLTVSYTDLNFLASQRTPIYLQP